MKKAYPFQEEFPFSKEKLISGSVFSFGSCCQGNGFEQPCYFILDSPICQPPAICGALAMCQALFSVLGTQQE
jgi:hypothetical protein